MFSKGQRWHYPPNRLINLLTHELLSSFLIQADEITLQVLLEPGRDPTTKSYMRLFRRGDPDRPVWVYQYHPTRGDEKIGHIGCCAHARRKFMDVVKAQGKNSKSRSGGKAVSDTRRSCKIEKGAREKDLSSDELYRIRQKDSRPVLDDFKKWLLKRPGETPPKGLLGKAIADTLNQWDRLCRVSRGWLPAEDRS